MSDIFIDGDFASGKGNCHYHCSPSCHPAQVGPEWIYGCTHPAWPGNKRGDFCPIVECGGHKEKCDMKGKQFVSHYRRGLSVKIGNCKIKEIKLTALITELDILMTGNPK